MKARLPVICLALSALLCCGGENLLENPSFEERGGEGALLPSCWRAHKVLSLENHHQLDGAMRRTGRHSVRLVSERTEGAKHYVLWMQSDLGPKVKRYPGGTPMVLSVWTKTDHPSVRYRIYVEALKRGDENYSCFLTGSLSNPDGSWRQAVLRFTLPSDRPNYYVCLQLLSKGTVWFDDAFLGAEGEAPRAVATAGEGAADRGEASNCLSNGSMEALDKAGHPLSWQTLQLGLKGRFHWSQPTGHTGDRSLRINCQLPQLKTEHYLMWIQRGVEKRLVNCPPGTEMELSVWSNTHGNPGVKYRFYIEMQRQQKYIGSYVSDTLTNYIGWRQRVCLKGIMVT